MMERWDMDLSPGTVISPRNEAAGRTVRFSIKIPTEVQGSRFKVQGSRFKVQGSRFKVSGFKGSRFYLSPFTFHLIL
jgi:hypothetical protein